MRSTLSLSRVRWAGVGVGRWGGEGKGLETGEGVDEGAVWVKRCGRVKGWCG